MKSAAIFFLLLISHPLYAQDTLPVKKFKYNGYIKDLHVFNLRDDFVNLATLNLIHNRINLRWQPSSRVTGAIEFRNRLFWGKDVILAPGFSSQLQNSNKAFDLTTNLVNTESLVLNASIDRVWMEYRTKKWSARAGRQRMDWGMATVWNPNDLFNTFNFLDFDYEERPGADAVTVQYFTGRMDRIESAISFGHDKGDVIAALRYLKNIANYDVQFIVASFHNQPTLGMGWCGRIKKAGIKGEVQYYLNGNGYKGQLNAVIEGNYVFDNGWHGGIGTLYNSRGTSRPTTIWELTSLGFSPKRLMPPKWNTMLTFSKEITPVLSATTTVVYSPVSYLVIILPSLTYNLTGNLDFSFVWQSFLSSHQYGVDDVSHRCFLSVKWSY